eukprot:m.198357 g.198357  ORF g.198357 m.198357 type:complete len:413 (+) comp20418_c0_seq1:28-1266(+)
MAAATTAPAAATADPIALARNVLPAALRAMERQVVSEQELFVEAVRAREKAQQIVTERVQKKLDDAEKTIKALRKDAKAHAAEVSDLQAALAEAQEGATKDSENATLEVARLQRDLKATVARARESTRRTDRTHAKEVAELQAEITALRDAAAATATAAPLDASANSPAPSSKGTRTPGRTKRQRAREANGDKDAGHDTVHLDVPASPVTKRDHAEVDEGDVISVNASPFGVSPATHDTAIKVVEKVWSTNPINIRTLEEHGVFVVIEYDPTEMRVGPDEQPPISLDGWQLKLDQADLGSGANRKVTTYDFGDMTLVPDTTVTLWQTQQLLDENAVNEPGHYHRAWPGLKVEGEREYELTLYDATHAIASSISWPPSYAAPGPASHNHSATSPSPKRLRLDEQPNQESCTVM